MSQQIIFRFEDQYYIFGLECEGIYGSRQMKDPYFFYALQNWPLGVKMTCVDFRCQRPFPGNNSFCINNQTKTLLTNRKQGNVTDRKTKRLNHWVKLYHQRYGAEAAVRKHILAGYNVKSAKSQAKN